MERVQRGLYKNWPRANIPQYSSSKLAFENKKYTVYDRFHGNGPYGKIPTKKKPIRTLGFPSRLPFHIIMQFIKRENWIFLLENDISHE